LNTAISPIPAPVAPPGLNGAPRMAALNPWALIIGA